MSVIEFHPDDLLDRELNGTQSDADRLRLAAHLERCAVCRLERQLRFDFETELGPRQPAPDLHPVVSDVLRAAGVKPLAAPPQVASAAPSTWRWIAASLVACALFGTVAAAAQLGLTEGMLEWLREGPSAPIDAPATYGQASRGARPDPRAATGAHPAIAVASPSSVESKELPHEAAAVLAPVEPSRPSLEQQWRRLARRSPSIERAGAKRATRVEAARSREQEVEARGPRREQDSNDPWQAASGQESEHVVVGSVAQPVRLPRAPASASATATMLFELASHARRRGASEDACALYQELQTRFPRSPEARLSLALLARLQLDRGQLAAAERAWRDLLEAYPQSAAAATARRRLGQSTP